MSWDKEPPSKNELAWMSEPPTKEAEISQTEAALLGAAQGATLGFADELTGAGETAIKAVKGEVPLNKEALLEEYRKLRDLTRESYKAAEEEHPGTYTAGQVAGGIGTAFVPGLNIAKGASLAKTALQGAGLGAAAGLGASEELDKEAALSAAQGAALGGGLGAAGFGITKGLSGLSSKVAATLSDKSDELAATAAGIKGKFAKDMSPEQIRELGRVLKQQGVVKAFQSPEDIMLAAQKLEETSGKAIGDLAQGLDEKGLLAYNPREVATEIQSKARVASEGQSKLQELLNMVRGSKKISPSQELLSPEQRLSFSEAQNLKGRLATEAFGKGGTAESKEVAKLVGGMVDENYLASLEQAAKETGDPALLEQLLDLRKQYRAGLKASEGAAELAKGEMRQVPKLSIDRLKQMSLTPQTSTMSKIAEVGSKSAQSLSDIASKSQPYTQKALRGIIPTGASRISSYNDLTKMNDEELSQLSTELKLQGPAGEEYARVIDNTLSKDKQGKDAMLFSLSQQPSFRKLIQKEEG